MFEANIRHSQNKGAAKLPFQYESELKDVAVQAFERDFLEEPYIRIEEFEYANGRSDLVYAKESEAYLQRRFKELGLSSPISRDDQLMTFLQLHGRGPITRIHFHDIGALDKRTKDQALNQLIEDGFIIETDENKIKTAPNLRRHIISSFAIELKLTNWRTALEQAHRSKSYSEYQFVALPESSIIPAQEHITEFTSKNIGLIEVTENGEYYIHHEPDKENPYSPMNKWRLNERTIIENPPAVT